MLQVGARALAKASISNVEFSRHVDKIFKYFSVIVDYIYLFIHLFLLVRLRSDLVWFSLFNGIGTLYGLFNAETRFICKCTYIFNILLQWNFFIWLPQSFVYIYIVLNISILYT